MRTGQGHSAVASTEATDAAASVVFLLPWKVESYTSKLHEHKEKFFLYKEQ